jgi:hypothetical protein
MSLNTGTLGPVPGPAEAAACAAAGSAAVAIAAIVAMAGTATCQRSLLVQFMVPLPRGLQLRALRRRSAGIRWRNSLRLEQNENF